MNASFPVSRSQYGPLAVEIHPDRNSLGIAAAQSAARWLQTHLEQHRTARVVFACAPSQNEFLAALVDPDLCGTAVAWDRIVIFHMDEYVGLPGAHPQSFRTYLRQHLLTKITPGKFHLLPAEYSDTDRACVEYSALLDEAPIDLICLGIGENGHLAFNDPPVADFYDRASVKRVELDDACRQQQVNDGCFASFDQVPRYALTLTLPVFRNARRLSVQVPGSRKASAVRAALLDPISTACPATLLRLHPAATLFLDPASASQLTPQPGN